MIGVPTLTKVLMSVNATENCKARRIVIQQGSERASKVPAQRRVAFLNYPPLQKYPHLLFVVQFEAVLTGKMGPR